MFVRKRSRHPGTTIGLLLAPAFFGPAQATVAAETETVPNIAGFVFQDKAYESLVWNYLERVWGNGATVLSESGDQLVLDSPEAVEALSLDLASRIDFGALDACLRGRSAACDVPGEPWLFPLPKTAAATVA